MQGKREQDQAVLAMRVKAVVDKKEAMRKAMARQRKHERRQQALLAEKQAARLEHTPPNPDPNPNICPYDFKSI